MRDDAVYLRHILDAIAKIEGYSGVGHDRFMNESHWHDATIRQFEIIGEATKHLSEELRQRYPAVPVLYMSGFTDDDVIRRGLLEPEQPFLQKPFGPDELARRVKALVDGEQST